MPYRRLEEYRKGIASSIVLTLLTCGIYNFFWQNHQIKTINLLLGRNVLSFWRWFFLTLITCGLYHIYHEYLTGKYIVEIQSKIGKYPLSNNLPLIALILSILGLPFITDAIEQKELNEIIDYCLEKRL
ncbi:MAG: hypothetical protein DSZ24_00520 [Thermodesulfatator sp.]|nr:MAG: hypothetical protein DSZ24_00520 [Thermodesulfatator sp.]